MSPKKAYSFRLPIELVERARAQRVDITALIETGLTEILSLPEITEEDQFRCSCCDEIRRESTNSVMKKWDLRSAMTALVCRACANKINQTKDQTIKAAKKAFNFTLGGKK